MGPFIVRRLLQMVPLLLGISLVLFAVIQAAPGGPEGSFSQTDDLGRDVFTRMLFGGRVSILIGLLAAALGTLLGSAIGGSRGSMAAFRAPCSCGRPTSPMPFRPCPC